MEDKTWILIVDDDLELLKRTETLLNKEGYQVSIAKSGLSACRFLESGNVPDLILLDVDMPQMDGYQTLAAIRKTVNGADIPVIYLTAMESAEFEIKGLEAGAVDYITKPFVNAILLAHVRTHIHISQKISGSNNKETLELNPAMLSRCKEILSETEFDIARFVGLGYTNQEIATELKYSYRYVKKMTSQIYDKLEVSNRNELRQRLVK